jgi:hypothetical protein
VAIEGPTGVGKTTLTARFATVLDAEAVLDPFKANPFLAPLLTSSSPPKRRPCGRSCRTLRSDRPAPPARSAGPPALAADQRRPAAGVLPADGAITELGHAVRRLE